MLGASRAQARCLDRPPSSRSPTGTRPHDGSVVAVLVAVSLHPARSRGGVMCSHNALTCGNVQQRTHRTPRRGTWKACWVKALGGSNPPSSARRWARDLRKRGWRALRLAGWRVARWALVAVLVEVLFPPADEQNARS